MVSEIRLYVEGGGDGADSKNQFRTGVGKFLNTMRDLARSKKIRWSITACGGRTKALDDFRIALKTHPQAFNVLLIDSEGPVQETGKPWLHLQQFHGWLAPDGEADNQCHFMAQAMEAWIVVDRENLVRYYGQRFNRNPLTPVQDVEQIDPKKLVKALESATRRTSKGSYHKIQHGPELLAQADAKLVRAAARHCDRLFTILENLISQETG